MAILSDLHARLRDERATGLRTWARPDRTEPRDNPLEGLAAYVRDHALRAQLLLCPGDLCDQADWDALPYAWERVRAVAAELGADVVAATVGNHDIDSRRHHGDDIAAGPRDRLRGYPVAIASKAVEYWGCRVTTIEDADWRVILLNSSLMRPLASGERDVGMIDDEALAAVGRVLALPSKAVNVLLCHHHPMPWPRFDTSDRSHMDRGAELVELLDDNDGQWMVIHGHRHQPHLEYLSGGSDAPVRLACGSVGARLSGTLGAQVNNQMHLVEFHVEEAAVLGLPIAGRILSHTWRPPTGWEPASPRDGLPHVCGFGYRQAAGPLAERLVRYARGELKLALEYVDMMAAAPAVPYLLPGDMVKLKTALREQHRCKLSNDEHGQLDRLRLPVPQ
jgi:hypothetical protein